MAQATSNAQFVYPTSRHVAASRISLKETTGAGPKRTPNTGSAAGLLGFPYPEPPPRHPRNPEVCDCKGQSQAPGHRMMHAARCQRACALGVPEEGSLRSNAPSVQPAIREKCKSQGPLRARYNRAPTGSRFCSLLGKEVPPVLPSLPDEAMMHQKTAATPKKTATIVAPFFVTTCPPAWSSTETWK